jgi:hypothetical protein
MHIHRIQTEANKNQASVHTTFIEHQTLARSNIARKRTGTRAPDFVVCLWVGSIFAGPLCASVRHSCMDAWQARSSRNDLMMISESLATMDVTDFWKNVLQ